MNSKEEKWKIIEDYPNYLISTFGRIKSIKTNKIHKISWDKRVEMWKALW